MVGAPALMLIAAPPALGGVTANVSAALEPVMFNVVSPDSAIEAFAVPPAEY